MRRTQVPIKYISRAALIMTPHTKSSTMTMKRTNVEVGSTASLISRVTICKIPLAAYGRKLRQRKKREYSYNGHERERNKTKTTINSDTASNIIIREKNCEIRINLRRDTIESV